MMTTFAGHLVPPDTLTIHLKIRPLPSTPMQLVISHSRCITHPTRPTWTRFFATLAVGAGCLIGAARLAAQPAHLAKGHQLVNEITAAQSQGVFTGVVDGTTVFLNRYAGSWDTAGDLSFVRFFDANRAANVGP